MPTNGWRKQAPYDYKLYRPYGVVCLRVTRTTATLCDLQVNGEKRQGSGTKLVHEAIVKAMKMNLRLLRVRVSQTTEAIKFWETFGVRKSGVITLERKRS